jgi:hypothetical protein
VEKFLALPRPQPVHDTSHHDSIFSINKNEPMEDWLSCLEKMFDTPCPHTQQQLLQSQECDQLSCTSSKANHRNCSEKAWSSWNFLEPRPLRMNDHA